MQDTGHVLFDTYGCGAERRAQLDAQIKSGERTFKEVSEEMWASLNVPFDDGFAVMERTLEMDADFQAFHRYCLEHDIPFNIISAGLKPVLRRVLDRFLGEEESAHINIVANDAEIRRADAAASAAAVDGGSNDKSQSQSHAPDGEGRGGGGEASSWRWRPVWRHDGSALGHDKAISMAEARREAERACAGEDGAVPLIVFIGDGVSDLPAAREADVLFARRGLRLEEHCREHGIAYTPFDTFADIQREIQRIKEEDEAATGGRGAPARFNPRANLWRRISNNSNPQRPALMSPAAEKPGGPAGADDGGVGSSATVSA